MVLAPFAQDDHVVFYVDAVDGSWPISVHRGLIVDLISTIQCLYSNYNLLAYRDRAEKTWNCEAKPLRDVPEAWEADGAEIIYF